MIVSDKGIVRIEGNKVVVQAELSAIIYSLNKSLAKKYGAQRSKEIIMQAVDKGFLSAEEIAKVAMASAKMLDDFSEQVVKQILGMDGE